MHAAVLISDILINSVQWVASFCSSLHNDGVFAIEMHKEGYSKHRLLLNSCSSCDKTWLTQHCVGSLYWMSPLNFASCWHLVFVSGVTRCCSWQQPTCKICEHWTDGELSLLLCFRAVGRTWKTNLEFTSTSWVPWALGCVVFRYCATLLMIQCLDDTHGLHRNCEQFS